MIRGISPEGLVFLCFASLMLVTVFMSTNSEGADSSQPLSFKNKDLEHYESPGDRKTREPQLPEQKNSEVRKTKTEDSRELREKEYWCKKATPQRKKIEHLTEEISEKERELTEENAKGSVKNKKTLTKTLTKTRRRLKDAEEKFSDLEDEAYRKGVPMGWLRCQFE